MNWTNLKVKIVCFGLAMVLMAGALNSLKAQQTAFEQLREKFKSGRIFHAEFSHRYIDSYTHDTTSNKGVIWVGEDRYKVRTPNQSVVVDGKTSMVYDDNRNRVIISKYDPKEDDFAPSRILNGIDSTYTVKVQERRGAGIYIELRSSDTFAIYKKVEIYLSEQQKPQKIKAVDPADNIIITSFDNGDFISSSQGMFHLDYPDGAEIVDMRN